MQVFFESVEASFNGLRNVFLLIGTDGLFYHIGGRDPPPRWHNGGIKKSPCGDIEQCSKARKASRASQSGPPDGVLHCLMSGPRFFFTLTLCGGGGIPATCVVLIILGLADVSEQTTWR